MPMIEHRRTYRIGYGYAAEFVYRSDPEPSVACEWSPAAPSLNGKGARDRLAAAYRSARDDFLQDVAQLICGTVANIEVDERGQPTEVRCYEPQSAN
jgi:hypothetical protein